MRKKKLIIFQTVGATVLLGILLCGKTWENNYIGHLYNYAMASIMNEVTLEELNAAGGECLTFIKKTPDKVVSAITRANEQSKYAYPIDEKSDTSIKQIHSVAGGMVSKVGHNNQLGLFIKIKHQDAISTYGHLCDISVVPMQRVQRGEIIGNYDDNCGEKFFYELDENL